MKAALGNRIGLAHTLHMGMSIHSEHFVSVLQTFLLPTHCHSLLQPPTPLLADGPKVGSAGRKVMTDYAHTITLSPHPCVLTHLLHQSASRGVGCSCLWWRVKIAWGSPPTVSSLLCSLYHSHYVL